MLDACDPDSDLEPWLAGIDGGSRDDREGADEERLFGSGFGVAGCEDDEDSDEDDDSRGSEPALGWTLDGGGSYSGSHLRAMMQALHGGEWKAGIDHDTQFVCIRRRFPL